MKILFNKPYGVVCQFSEHDKHQTLKDFIPIPRVYPAGRLDTDSEGLIILTDDGLFQHQISDPKYKMQKIYWAQVEGSPKESDLDELRRGVDLGDFKTMPAAIKIIDQPKTLWERIVSYSTAVKKTDRKSTRLNSSHIPLSRMPSSA